MSLFLIDTSAIARRAHPEVDRILEGLLRSRSAATCVTVDLEMGYSGVSHSDVKTTMSRRATDFQLLAISETIADRAREVQVLMAARGQHRAAGIVDLLTAAIAEHHGAVLLHYDEDFEHIAAVTGQAQKWVVPRGTAG